MNGELKNIIKCNIIPWDNAFEIIKFLENIIK